MYADLNGFIKSLFKTKMCRYVIHGKPCPYGDNCTFAHSVNELRSRQPRLNLIDGPSTDQCVKLTLSPASTPQQSTPQISSASCLPQSPSNTADAKKKVSFQDSITTAAQPPSSRPKITDNKDVQPLSLLPTPYFNPFDSTPPPPGYFPSPPAHPPSKDALLSPSTTFTQVTDDLSMSSIESLGSTVVWKVEKDNRLTVNLGEGCYMRCYIDNYDELDRFSDMAIASLGLNKAASTSSAKEEANSDDSMFSNKDDSYDCMTRKVFNNPNLIMVDVGRNAWGLGAQGFWELVNCYTDRGLKTLIIYTLHSMTDQVKATWEESFLFSNDSIQRLLDDSTNSRPLNDAFRAYTGLDHMINGLKLVCSPSDNVVGAINLVRLELGQKVICYIKEKGRTIPLPNMQHYGESMRRFGAVKTVAIGAFVAKDPAEFVYGARTLDRFEHRQLPSQFIIIIPRYDVKPGIKDKFFKIRFCTERNPQMRQFLPNTGFLLDFN
eukprot:scaffold23990_cov47-Cyclotella_meneghiniana.AAC.5